jgi:uncharacterized protein HemX
MSVSYVSSANFFNTQSENVQNQEQWLQEFQKLTQELQSGTLASTGAIVQTTAQAQIAAAHPGAPTSAAPAAQSGDSTPFLISAPQGTPEHSLHLRRPHHLQVGADTDSGGSSNRSSEIANPGNASTAQQAYSSWQQNLQQVALNGDLLSAQKADWQPVSLSA